MEETTGLYTSPVPEPAGLILTAEAQHYLQVAGKWAKFLGIMGFIITGIIALAALFAGTIFSTLARLSPNSGVFAGSGTFITVLYLLIALISFFPALYLYQFGDRIRKGIALSDTASVTYAAGKLKSFFKFYGILIIIVVSLDVLILIGTIIGAGVMAGMRH